MNNKHEIKDLIEYNHDTGMFTFKDRSDLDPANRSKYSFKQAGSIHANGYIVINLLKKQYQAQHLAWYFITGSLPSQGQVIDHINNNPSDNRAINLRLATKRTNALNMDLNKVKLTNIGLKGVRMQKGAYTAIISANMQQLRIERRFKNKIDAINFYDSEMISLAGDFAVTNEKLKNAGIIDF